MNNRQTEKILKPQIRAFAKYIAKQAQEDLLREDAIVKTDDVLEKIPYTTFIVEREDTINVVPTFDNLIDEYSNSKTIVESGFEGNYTLTKMKNKLTRQ